MPEQVEPVLVLEENDEHVAQDPPVRIDRRTRGAALKELAAGFIDFPYGGQVGPWTLPYEEVSYVVAGTLSLHYQGRTVSGGPGAVLALDRGATFMYQGTPCARAFYSLMPANWMELQT